MKITNPYVRMRSADELRIAHRERITNCIKEMSLVAERIEKAADMVTTLQKQEEYARPLRDMETICNFMDWIEACKNRLGAAAGLIFSLKLSELNRAAEEKEKEEAFSKSTNIKVDSIGYNEIKEQYFLFDAPGVNVLVKARNLTEALAKACQGSPNKTPDEMAVILTKAKLRIFDELPRIEFLRRKNNA